jgi:CheY-like chemotaxis protein
MIEAPDNIHLVSKHTNIRIQKGSFADDYPLKILIAEDNIINQKLIERILHKLGYQTDTATNGIHALNLFVKKEHNVILMDVRMPGMDGLETTHSIRQMAVEQPCIIAMTAGALSSDRDECLQNGMDDYLSKPIDMKDLTCKLKMASTCIANKKQ